MLDEVQRLMPSRPQAAFERLNGMDISQFRDSADMARWALLYTEAMMANRIPVSSDTLINVAIDYYAGRGRRREADKARQLRRRILAVPAGSQDALWQARYCQKVREYALYKERCRKEAWMGGFLFLFLTAGTVILWQMQRLRSRRMENDALLSEASGLQRLLSGQCERNETLRTLVQGQLQERFTVIGRLCDTYYEAQGTRAERKAIAEQVKAEIDALQHDPSVFAEMEKAVNDCRNGLLDVLRRELPALKTADYQLMVYLACGFSNRSISLLLGETIEVVYKRKSRLKARIRALAPAQSSVLEAIF